MRDPLRIKGIMRALEEYWNENPDIRLGQLLIWLAKPSTPCPELFYIEDDKLMSNLQAELAKIQKMPE